MIAGRLARRAFLALGGAALLAPFVPRLALSQVPTGVPLHGISAFGELKYGPDFTHFDYADPDAPQGGFFSFSPWNWGYNQSVLTFNTLNSFVMGGDAPPRMEMCFDSLMAGALDEPDSAYGLLARTVTVSPDRNSYSFALRPEARFHDGTPLTARDVAYTFNLFKERGHPSLRLPLAEMVEAAAEDDATFRIAFSGRQPARAVFSVIGMPIVSQAFFEANPFDASQLNPPLGSGPYRVGRVNPGTSIDYLRNADYWGRDLPVRRGLYHFDRIRIDFYQDRNAGFEAFKKGEIHFRLERTARIWATGYDFPAVAEGRVVMRDFPEERNASMQGWALNQRRERFADPRVREAIGLCFDFEWTNRTMFFGLYERAQSLFEKSEFKAQGLPSTEETELLERFRDDIPHEAFGPAVETAASNGSGRDRDRLRRAADLLAAAGWKRPQARPAGFWSSLVAGPGRDAAGGRRFLLDAAGRRLRLEMLVNDEGFVRINAPFADNMRAIGIDASIRLVDSAQYQARMNDFDFDMVGIAATLGATPARAALETFFHSRSARTPGTRNLPGTASPAIDELIEMAGAVQSRDELVVILRVLDRILRARRDWIPNWQSTNHRAAYWDRFGFREPKPDYGFPVEALWWIDEEKARAIGRP